MSPTPQIALVADSTTYLPPELIEKHSVHQVSLYVGLEGRQQRESDVTDLDEFYARMKASNEAVTTSQPSVGDFIAVYEPLLGAGNEIVSVHLSSGISGTYESALQARERLTTEGKGGERIHVFDSVSVAGGMAMVLLEGAAAIAAGDSPEQVMAALKTGRESMRIWFAIDTLEFLRRGGRIGGARAWIGSTLKIKPILTFEEEVKPVERVRTRARSLQRLEDYARERHESGADNWVVQYIQDRETAEHLVERCIPIFGHDPMFVSEIGPVIGAHAGPGLLGIGGIASDRLSQAGG